MRISGIIIAAIFVSVFEASAQREIGERDNILDRVFTGGGIQLSFGNNTTIVGASPIIGYMITPKWAAGIGGTYVYRKFDDITSNLYGGKVFTSYAIFNPFFAYMEYEALSWDPNPFDDRGRELAEALNVGGGIMQPIGRYAAFQFMVVYDLLYDNLRSPAPNALSIRGGVTVGF